MNAFSMDGNEGRPALDEAQFLRKAGELASRIQDELRPPGSDSGAYQKASGSDQPEPATVRTEFTASAGHHPGGDGPHVELPERTTSGAGHEQQSRDEFSKREAEWSRLKAGSSLADTQSLPKAMPRGVKDGLRIFNGRDSDGVAPQSTLDSVSSVDVIRQELMDELSQEQSRWTERHAMQVGSIDERTQQLSRIDAEIELRELELDRRERDLDLKAREFSTQVEAAVRNHGTHDWDAAQNEMDRLATEVRAHADRASRLESDLVQARRMHANELDQLRERLSDEDDSRAARTTEVMEECDQWMSELSAQRTAWEAEQLRRREEIARERLEQRDELNRLREEQLGELRIAQAAFEKERDATAARLDRERRDWDEKFNREQDELLNLKWTVENEVARLRGDVSLERAEWESQQERLRIAQRDEQAKHQQMLETARIEVAAHSEREHSALEVRRAEFEQRKKEHAELLDAQTRELEEEREGWRRERGQEAAILQTERTELESDVEQLRAEKSRFEAERQQTSAALKQQRVEHDEALQRSWEHHQASLQQSELESVARQRVLTEKLQQQENELTTRMQKIKEEIRTTRELCSRQIAQDKECFAQACEKHEVELGRARAELKLTREHLDREKRDFADEMARGRQQIEQDRKVLRNSLSQMDAQIRVAATSLLPGMSEAILAPGSANGTASVPSGSRDDNAGLDIQKSEFLSSTGRKEAQAINDDNFEEAISEFENSATSVTTSDESMIAGHSQVSLPAPSVDSKSDDEADAHSTHVDEVAETNTRERLSTWEPGQSATHVDSDSDKPIRRIDSSSELGGVSGIGHRPHIASVGPLAQASADAQDAEVVFDESSRQPEWVGTVATRTADSDETVLPGGQGDGRREALESYRSKLSSLQVQLRQMSDQSSDDSASDEAASDETLES